MTHSYSKALFVEIVNELLCKRFCKRKRQAQGFYRRWPPLGWRPRSSPELLAFRAAAEFFQALRSEPASLLFPVHPLLATTNRAFGPPSLELLSFGSGRTSYRDGSTDSITQPSAKASSSSFRDNRRGPWSPGSASEKQSRNSRPPGFKTDASPWAQPVQQLVVLHVHGVEVGSPFVGSECGYRQAKEKLFTCDGGDWCWTIHALYFSEATGILDWYHASEHVWATAHSLFVEDAAAIGWADQALALMRDTGGAGLWS